MRFKEWLRKKILSKVGLVKYESTPDDDRITFINDEARLTKQRVEEYNVWYWGDSDELLNYYTHQNTLEYNYEPWHSRNKQEYFWSISSTETGSKRTHSGQPRNIVDTLVNIIKFPKIAVGSLIGEEDAANKNLSAILKACNLKQIYKQQQMPMTLVEGWGCYKINWDKNISDYPYVVYYRANNVDFIYAAGRIVGIVFKDYYTDGENRRYLLTETRSLKYDEATGKRNLVIEKELFKTVKDAEEYVVKADFNEVPELANTEKYVEIGPYDDLLAVPCIFFENTFKTGGYGRSIFTGKLDLFDDLDQCLSQSSNSIRRSTPIEWVDSEFLERDKKTGLPIQPKAYDRKYTVYRGQIDAEGGTGRDPVQITQPQINFTQYTDAAVAILLQIVNGIMAPATLGIDIAKKDNAEAEREKEKQTIFTRNALTEVEEDILRKTCVQLLCAYEFMTKNEITVKDYDISIKFSEFADDSYENKLEKLGAAYDSQQISDDMYMDKLYGDTLSRADYNRELKWLREKHTEPREEGMEGAAGGGANLPGMLDNMTNGGGSDGEGEPNEEEI